MPTKSSHPSVFKTALPPTCAWGPHYPCPLSIWAALRFIWTQGSSDEDDGQAVGCAPLEGSSATLSGKQRAQRPLENRGRWSAAQERVGSRSPEKPGQPPRRHRSPIPGTGGGRLVLDFRVVSYTAADDGDRPTNVADPSFKKKFFFGKSKVRRRSDLKRSFYLFQSLIRLIIGKSPNIIPHSEL